MAFLAAPRIANRMRRFLSNENGSATMLSLQFTLIALVVGGLSIDFNKAISDRTKLQLAADTAAHAALYTREEHTNEEARAKALQVIDEMLRDDLYGGAVSEADIEFGSWNAGDNQFVPNDAQRTAVRVRAEMTSVRGNASRNLLLGLVGRKTFNVETASVYGTYFPPCFTEGFVAEGIVDIQSGNTFTDGFCLHSNTHVSLNSNNFFEPGTVVSMPDLDNLDMPSSGFESNIGLDTALRQGAYRLRLLNKLPSMIEGLWTADPDSFPRRLHGGNGDGTLIGGNGNTFVHSMESQQKVSPSDFIEGAVNTMSCSAGGKLTFEPGLYQNFAFVSDCQIKFGNGNTSGHTGVYLEDVVIATSNTSVKSFNSPAEFTLGRDDNCAPGGGSVLMTLGGVDFASNLQVYNSQILAIGNIEFAANANGIQGASFVSYGSIDSTSEIEMGFCQGRGMENLYRADYFRMLQ